MTATGLRSRAIRLPPGFAVSLDERALRGRLGCALVRRSPRAADVIARVSSLSLTDRAGVPLSLEAGRARVSFAGSGAVTVGDVVLVKPFLLLELGPGEGTIARALAMETTAEPAIDARTARPHARARTDPHRGG